MSRGASNRLARHSRNAKRLVHAYTDVDRGILWTTIVSDLPALLEQLRAIDGINDIPGEKD